MCKCLLFTVCSSSFPQIQRCLPNHRGNVVEAGKAEFWKREERSTLDYANETIPEIKTKVGGRKSTIRKVKCLNAICQGKGWTQYNKVTKRFSFLGGKCWLKPADKYFLQDLKQVAISKTKVPRGQYIINNLKRWPCIVSPREPEKPTPKTQNPSCYINLTIPE